jgi:hypothetical protein
MEHDHEELGEQLESDAEKMQGRAEELGQEIGDVREDWRSKQEDSGVPGAEPSGGDDEDDAEHPD